MYNGAIICIVAFSVYVMRPPDKEELKPLYRENIMDENINTPQQHDEMIPIKSDMEIIEIAKNTDSPYIEMHVKATAYCPCEKCCGQYADGKTATMTDAYLPGVAVDKRKIKLGSKLIVPGYNGDMIVTADDVGGAIKGDKIDVRFPAHQEALEWGVKYLTIKVYN